MVTGSPRNWAANGDKTDRSDEGIQAKLEHEGENRDPVKDFKLLSSHNSADGDSTIIRQNFYTASDLKDLFHNIHPKRIISLPRDAL